MNKEEIKKIAKEEFINNVMKNIDSALIFTYISNLEKENNRLNNIINLIKNNIDITIQIIKEQPTGNDEWILERLNGIKNIGELKGE